MGKMQRSKGAAFECVLVKEFAEAMPGAEVRRNLQSQGGSVVGNDLVCPCFAIEAKHGIKPVVRRALEQAVSDAPAHKWPVAVIKDNRRKPFIAMPLSDFLELVTEWWELKGQ